MKISDAFPSKYLKSQELLDADKTYTIKDVKIEVLGQGEESEEKPIIYFHEIDKGFACNRTNANTIAGLYGDDTDGWVGQKITLFAQEVDFAGRQTLAIRVRMRKPTAGNQQHQQQSAPPAPTNNPVAAARAAAWKAMQDLHPGAPIESITAPWRALLASVGKGKKSDLFGVIEWNAVKEAIDAEASLVTSDGCSDEIPM